MEFYLLFYLFLFSWTILKVFIEFVTILLLLYVFVFWLRGTWDLSSLTRNRTHTPTLEGEVFIAGPPGSP